MNNWYVMQKEETERLTANISQRTGDRLDRRVEQHGEKSLIVAEALQMYLRRGDFARLEQKLNLVLAERGVPYRGRPPEMPAAEHESQPHGLTDNERRKLEGVMGKADAARVQTRREGNTRYRLQVKLPKSLVEAVYDSIDGERYIGKKVVGPALREWFEHGGWLARLEEKLDFLLGDHDLPQPVRSRFPTQVANKMEAVDHERYYDTVSVSVSAEDERDVDVSSITVSDRLRVHPDDVTWDDVPHRSAQYAGVIMATFRYELDNDETSTVSLGDVRDRVENRFDADERTQEKAMMAILEQLREEYHPKPLLRYAMDVSARDVTWFPELPMGAVQDGPSPHPAGMHRAATEKVENVLGKIQSLGRQRNPSKRKRRMREYGIKPSNFEEVVEEYETMKEWAKGEAEQLSDD